MGKRRSKNIDEDDDGPRPGKRSCTMKTTVSPQPSPTLIECPEPGCDKKYKHINGLRYHQAHAHLEEVSGLYEVLSMLWFKFLKKFDSYFPLFQIVIMNMKQLKIKIKQKLVRKVLNQR